MNTRHLIRASVRTLLERADIAAGWSLQGFGMLRLYLSPEVRLHIWDSRFATANVSTIHDHPWDFRSYIVSGQIRQHRFVERPPGPTENDLFMRQRIRCGPGGCAVAGPEPVFLVRLPLEEYSAGDWYEQFADEIHQSLPSDGTVTLVERHFRSDNEHARVYYNTPTWVSAEPRPATPDEVQAVVSLALERWDAP